MLNKNQINVQSRSNINPEINGNRYPVQNNGEETGTLTGNGTHIGNRNGCIKPEINGDYRSTGLNNHSYESNKSNIKDIINNINNNPIKG